MRVIFNWGTDLYQARQLVTERLQQAISKLPPGVENPQISPTTSPVGLVVQYAFTLDADAKDRAANLDLMEVRRLVDWQVSNRLLAVPGVSQVLVFGGEARQYQVLVDPAKLVALNISLEQVEQAAKGANTNAPGGYLITPDREQLIRGIGRIESIADLQASTITSRSGIPIKLSDVAEVKIGGGIKRGDGSFKRSTCGYFNGK